MMVSSELLRSWASRRSSVLMSEGILEVGSICVCVDILTFHNFRDAKSQVPLEANVAFLVVYVTWYGLPYSPSAFRPKAVQLEAVSQLGCRSTAQIFK